MPRNSATSITSPRATRLRLALLIGAGGAVGTAIRAIAEHLVPAQPGTWPWTTFLLNVVGSFLLGALLTGLGRRGPDEGRVRALRLALGTGLLGGFTTYSTFTLEVDALMREGEVALGAAYAVGSVLLGASAALLGVRAARRLVPLAPGTGLTDLAERLDPTLPIDPDEPGPAR